MKKKNFILLVSFLFLFTMTKQALAANANLFVSVVGSGHLTTFSASMVVEVLIIDSDINDTDEAKGEPDITVNGKRLRMVQAANGNWYGYFSQLNSAQLADQNALNPNSASPGPIQDFGIFCSSDLDPTVLWGGVAGGGGVDFTNSNGLALPRAGGIDGGTQGTATLTTCTGAPTSSPLLSHVVPEAPDMNTHPAVLPGQIGLNPYAWPLVQLFNFLDGSNVVIQYNRGGGVQTATLDYKEAPAAGNTDSPNDSPAEPFDMEDKETGVDSASGDSADASANCNLQPGKSSSPSVYFLFLLGFVFFGILFCLGDNRNGRRSYKS